MKRKFFGTILLLLFVASLSSCSLFRKKNRCNTCPTWDEIVIGEDHADQKIN